MIKINIQTTQEGSVFTSVWLWLWRGFFCLVPVCVTVIWYVCGNVWKYWLLGWYVGGGAHFHFAPNTIAGCVVVGCVFSVAGKLSPRLSPSTVGANRIPPLTVPAKANPGQ